jgi:hypothetical protein
MGKNVTYKPDFKGVARILKDPAMQRACVSAATKGQGFAQSISPVESGEYRRSFRVVPLSVAGRRGDRAGAKLVNVSGHAAAVEWRLGLRVLGRTVDYIEKNGP